MNLYQPIISGSLTVSGSVIISGSLSSTAGFTGSFSGTATTASYALTSSYLNPLNQTLIVSGSTSMTGSLQVTGSIATTGTITAQTLVVQTITSSIDYITGSSINGSLMTNTHQFTGSVLMTGSFTQTGTNTTSSFAGSVGIGNTSPFGKLSISKAAAPTGYTAADMYINLGYIESAASSSRLIGFGYNGASTEYPPSYIGYTTISTSGNEYGDLIFGTRSSTSGTVQASERMRISSAGNVGIGANSYYDGSGYGSTAKYLTIYNSAASSLIELASNSTVDDTNMGSINFINAANSGASGAGRYGIAYIRGSITNASGTGNTSGGYLSFGTKVDGGNQTERMRITSGGNVLINQTTDQLSTWKLQVTGNARFNDSIIFPTAAAANAGDMYLGQGSKYSGGFTANDFLLINQGSSSAGIVQITAGVVTNGVYLARNANSWSAVSSDARNKKDFETTQGLAEVLQIEPVKYNYIWDEEGETKRLGFTAQNLQSLIPEMVIATGKKADDGSDYLTITPDYLLPVLVKAIQEQSQTITSLQDRLTKAGL